MLNQKKKDVLENASIPGMPRNGSRYVNILRPWRERLNQF